MNTTPYTLTPTYTANTATYGGNRHTGWQPRLLHPDIAYKQMLANDIMKIIGVMVLSYVINMTVAGVVQVIGLFAGGIDWASSLFSSGSYWDIANAITEGMGNAMGVSAILGAAAGMFALLILRGKKLFTTDITHLNGKCNILELSKLFMLIMGLSFLTSLVMYGVDLLLGDGGSASSAMDDAVGGLLKTPSGILYVVLFGPIIEEIIFRAGIMRYLERYGANFAIVISSLAFGLYHIILFQAIFAFFCGLILAYTAGRFSLKWAMLLHILNNGISSVLSLTDIPEFLEWSIFGGCFLIAVVILIFDRGKFRQQRQAGAPVAILDVLGRMPGAAGAHGYGAPYGPAQSPYGAAAAQAPYGQGAPVGAPYGPAQPPYGAAAAQVPYGQGAPVGAPYGPAQPPYGAAAAQVPYGHGAPVGAPYGPAQPPYGAAAAQAPYGQGAPVGAPYGSAQPPYGAAAAQAAPYGQGAPVGAPYGPAQPPYGAPPQIPPAGKPHPYRIAFSNPLMIIILAIVFLLGLATVFLM